MGYNLPAAPILLLEQFLQRAPGPVHRAALEACALVRVTTEELLAELLTVADAHDLFQWLRELTFVETRPGGLFPHDVAREALTVDLRWRNPGWYAELHRRARVHYTRRLHESRGAEQQLALFDMEELDFQVGGRSFGVYGHDWRATPALVWLELLGQREIAASPEAVRPSPMPAVAALSQAEFMGLVENALRDYTRPDVLRGNALLRDGQVVATLTIWDVAGMLRGLGLLPDL